MQAASTRETFAVLVFEIAGHRYGVPTSAVREVLRAVQPQRLAGAPAVVIGVINVRGEIAALIDLRARFGLPRAPLAASDVFVLSESAGRLVAFRADRTEGLMKVAREDVRALATAVPRARFGEGTVMLPDGLLLLCDVPSFLEEAELRTLDGALSALEASGPP